MPLSFEKQTIVCFFCLDCTSLIVLLFTVLYSSIILFSFGVLKFSLNAIKILEFTFTIFYFVPFCNTSVSSSFILYSCFVGLFSIILCSFYYFWACICPLSFCSSILMMSNFYAFNLSIFCHYILQFLYIHFIISVIPDKYISVCITIFCLMFCEPQKHSILMVVLFIAYHKFQLFSLCLNNLFLFVVLN